MKKIISALGLIFPFLLMSCTKDNFHHRMDESTFEELSSIDGATITYTIDEELQKKQDSLVVKRLMELYAKSGHAALMEVQSGKLLAISNWERVGDNFYASTSNHIVEDIQVPGSAFSAISYMALLEDGRTTSEAVIDTENTADCPQSWNYYGKEIRDDHPLGVVTLEEAIIQSSAIAIAKAVTEAYSDNPETYLSRLFQIGCYETLDLEQNFIKFNNSRSRDVNDASWSRLSLAQMSYGYEQLMSPISLLAIYNAIANHGILMRPYLVESVSLNDTILCEHQPKIIRENICSPSTLTAVQHALEGVVDRGTAATQWYSSGEVLREGSKSKIINIAGKTGTAQRFENGTYVGNGHWVTFVGYFPSENPRYSMIVQFCAVPGGNFGRPGGGYMAGPVVRYMAEYIYNNQ